jgi:hypothetical protein
VVHPRATQLDGQWFNKGAGATEQANEHEHRSMGAHLFGPQQILDRKVIVKHFGTGVLLLAIGHIAPTLEAGLASLNMRIRCTNSIVQLSTSTTGVHEALPTVPTPPKSPESKDTGILASPALSSSLGSASHRHGWGIAGLAGRAADEMPLHADPETRQPELSPRRCWPAQLGRKDRAWRQNQASTSAVQLRGLDGFPA